MILMSKKNEYIDIEAREDDEHDIIEDEDEGSLFSLRARPSAEF